MVKKQEYAKEAERLYVEKHMTLQEISEKLPVGHSTLRKWSSEGGWAAKRKEALAGMEDFHLELYALGRELAAAIKRDLRDGEEVSPARFYALGRIMDTAEKSYKYEERALRADDGKDGKGKASLEDILEALNDKLFGRG